MTFLKIATRIPEVLRPQITFPVRKGFVRLYKVS